MTSFQHIHRDKVLKLEASSFWILQILATVKQNWQTQYKSGLMIQLPKYHYYIFWCFQSKQISAIFVWQGEAKSQFDKNWNSNISMNPNVYKYTLSVAKQKLLYSNIGSPSLIFFRGLQVQLSSSGWCNFLLKICSMEETRFTDKNCILGCPTFQIFLIFTSLIRDPIPFHI